jgi:uncharacterized coiled-coil DUF342 family protein
VWRAVDMESTNIASLNEWLHSAFEYHERVANEFDQIQSAHPEIWKNNFVIQALDLLREKVRDLPVSITVESLEKLNEITEITRNLISLANYCINVEVAA